MTRSFGSLALSAPLLAVLKELGYAQLTPIQAASIPLLLAGKDLIGQSRTGSGKTLAFALPILEKLELQPRAVRALVLCPTRELCAQVARELRTLGRKHAGLTVVTLNGGARADLQAKALQRGVHVAVGTPGRVLDHLGRGRLDVSQVGTVVLDEADRMLDMGFVDDMERILRALPVGRQTVFFSATFPKTIEALSRSFQRDAARVTLDTPEQAVPEIRQLVLSTAPEHKLSDLLWALAAHSHDSALIFCNLKTSVVELTQALDRSGISVDCLHGDLQQRDRDRVMARLRNQSVRRVVASDVAARGLDITGLDLVVNYDLPTPPEVYVHRIGRTGRAGRLGLAISLVSPHEGAKLQAIERLLPAPLQPLVREPESDALQADRHGALRRAAPMQTIQISGGRSDKLRPGDILGALTGEAGGLKPSDVGKIEVHDRLSYVAVATQVGPHAVKSLNAGTIKRKRFRATLLG